MSFRTDKPVVYIHESDPLCNKGGRLSVDESWYHADDQPAGTSKFAVRPLNPDEWKEILAIDDAVSQIGRSAELGFVSIDGDEIKASDLNAGIAQEVGALVIDMTARPTLGRGSRLTADQSEDSSDTP